jgi:hypothetical protein
LQLAPAANEPELGQGEVAAVASAYGPPVVTAIELMEMEELPVFLKFTEWMALEVPTTTLPKLTVVGETVVCAWAMAGVNRLNIAMSDSKQAF